MASISTCFKITLKPYYHYTLNLPAKSTIKLQNHHISRTTKSLKLTSKQSYYITNVRNFCTEIRASFDVEDRVSYGRIIESDKLATDVRKRTMEAVDSYGRRVTVGDVASKAGIKLTEAQKALQAIAADTNGFLQVSDKGDVLYVFTKDYRSKLAARSLWIRTEPYLEKTKSVAEYLVRVTFGTALIASILIVFTAIIAILTSCSDKDDRKRSRGISFGSLLDLYPSRSELFWYWDPYYHRRQRDRYGNSGMSFIEPVFSFVFGDGDPNESIEEARWKLIGQYIGSNGGVVTAEELTPYLDVETAQRTDDDSYILPVLLRFNGQPQVDEEGNILYRFPSLQRTAASERDKKKELGRQFSERVGGTNFIKEKKWTFSKISDSEMTVVGGLGGLNLFGVIVLGAMLKDLTITEPNGFISFVIKIFPLLQIYAASFFVIPLVRWYFIRKTNVEIEKRNRARELRARALELADVSLRRKILSARNMSERTVIGDDQIVYTTEKDVLEQEYDSQEWDRRFMDIKKFD
uniref:uncharacterized protein At5g03900, chloroplastic-like n=1 Tax=Erigeron canadensis TaxID=72917 RepID=UPI001CB94E4E|nr:uncharacterized protein At5g03900, chloroplastic-like [Erigeron canadensis]